MKPNTHKAQSIFSPFSESANLFIRRVLCVTNLLEVRHREECRARVFSQKRDVRGILTKEMTFYLR